MTDSPFASPTSAGPWRPGVALSLLLAVAASAVPDLVHMGWATRDVDREMREAVETYDTYYDPILVSGGEVSVLGERLLDSTDADRRFLVDPNRTVSDEELAAAGRYIVVRSDTLVEDRGFQRREYKIADLQNFVGVDPIRIDGASLQSYWQTDGYWIMFGAMALLGAVVGAMVFVGLVIQALVVGPLVRLAKGSKVTFGAAFSAALLASLAPQVFVFVFRYLVWDPGFFLRSALILLLTVPAAWLLMPNER